MMNPMQLISMMQQSGNPMGMLMQMSQQNPLMGQAMRALNGKTPGQMEQYVRQMAQQRGVDLNQLAQQMGIRMPNR